MLQQHEAISSRSSSALTVSLARDTNEIYAAQRLRASLSMADGGATAASVHYALARTCLSPVEYRVFPRLDLPLRRARPTEEVVIPPLIKGYERLGAYLCGAPAWDPDFNTADLLLLLPMSRIAPRYTRRFGGHGDDALARRRRSTPIERPTRE